MLSRGDVDSVLFLSNAIDDVDHDGRLTILAEIRRVLRPGGVLVFAGHNLHYYRKPAWVFGGFSIQGSLKELIRENMRRSIKYLTNNIHHLRMRKHEVFTPEYSIINEPAFGYRLLTYFMRRDQQIAQLEAAGFINIQVFDADGQLLFGSEPCRAPFLHYTARKPD